MSIRAVFWTVRYHWQNVKGTLPARTSLEKILHLRYELSTWCFTVGSLSFAAGLWIYTYRNFDQISYFYAMAFPGGIRALLLIPLVLVLVMLLITATTILLWRDNRSILKRLYFLFQIVYGVLLIYIYARVDLLFALF